MITAGRRCKAARATRTSGAVRRDPIAKPTLGPYEMALGGRKPALLTPFAFNHHAHLLVSVEKIIRTERANHHTLAHRGTLRSLIIQRVHANHRSNIRFTRGVNRVRLY